MGKRIRDYVKYTKTELENYTKLPGTCVQKINKNIHINFPPYGLGSMKSTLLNIISEKKIGSYDYELNGIILDIRNIKVLGNLAALRFDDPTLHIDIQADCYVFKPQIGSIVRGLVKHIASHQISVIIYRVFNVSIRLSATERYDNTNIELNSEIEFRIKNFDLENLMPYIEGELVAREMPLKCLERKHTYLHVSDSDSNSTDNEEQSIRKPIKIPRNRKKSLTLSQTEKSDDEEIVFSEIFHLKPEEVDNIKNGINKVKKTGNKIEFSESFRLQPDEAECFEIVKDNNEKKKLSNINIDNIKKNKNIKVAQAIFAEEENNKIKESSSSTEDDSENEQTESNKIKQMILKTPKKFANIKSDTSDSDKSQSNTIDRKRISSLNTKEVQNSDSSDDDFKYKLPRRNSEMGEKIEKPISNSSKNESSSDEEIEFKNVTLEKQKDKNKKNKSVNFKNHNQLPVKVEISNSDSEDNFISSTRNEKNPVVDIEIPSSSKKNKKHIEPTNIKLENLSPINSKHISHSREASESEDIFDGILTLESPLKQQKRFENIIIGNEVEKTPNKQKSIANKLNIDCDTSTAGNTKIKSEPPSTTKKKKALNSEEDNFNSYLKEMVNIVKSEKELNESNLFCTPNLNKKKRIKKTSESSSISFSIPNMSNESESVKKRTTSISSTNNDSQSPKKHAKVLKNKEKKDAKLSRSKTPTSTESITSQSVDNAMDNIVARVLSNKTDSVKKRTPSESSSVNAKKNKKESTTSDSQSIDNVMDSIMSRVLSIKTESPKKSKTSESSSINNKQLSAELKIPQSVDNAMDNIIARVLSNKSESPKKKIASVNEKKIKKSIVPETNSIFNTMESIVTRVSSDKIVSPKKETYSESSSIDDVMNSIVARVLKRTASESSSANEKKIKKQSDSKSIDNAMGSIMSRVLSNKTESPKKNDTIETFKQKNSRKTNSKSNAKATQSESSSVTIDSEIINNINTQHDTNKQSKEKKLTDLDSSVAQLLAKVQKNKSQPTNCSKNVKKRKLSNSDSDKSVKKSKKSVNKKRNDLNESTNDNNISLNGDSFSVPPLSSTKIESVKKKLNI